MLPVRPLPPLLPAQPLLSVRLQLFAAPGRL